MDDSLLVRRFERLGESASQSRSASSTGMAPCAIRSASVGPSTSSITKRAQAAGILEAMDLRDVRVIEGGEHSRFSLEAREAIGIVGDTWRRTLIATSRLSVVSRAR